MNTLTIHPTDSSSRIINTIPLLVYLNGLRRRDLHLESITCLPGPDFNKAKVSVKMSSNAVMTRRVEDIDAVLTVGDRLTVCLSGAYRRVIFDGYIVVRNGRIDGNSERIEAQAEDLVSILLDKPVLGRWQQSSDASDGPSAVFIPDGRCLFNADPSGLASEEYFDIAGRPCRIFMQGKTGRTWSVADMLGYLVSAHFPDNIRTVGLEEFSSLTESIYPARVDLTGLSIKEALSRTAGLAGLSVRTAYDDWASSTIKPTLVFYRSGRGHPRRVVHLQSVAQDVDTRQSNLWKATISIRRRPAKPRIIVLGGLKRYEATFQLKPGWDSNFQTQYYREFVRHKVANWPTVKDVFRKWVLNESDDYSRDPYNLERFDFATISSQDFMLVKSRRFLPCISTDLNGDSLGIVVEVSFDSGSTWRRYPGAIRTLPDECGIYLADDALPVDYFQAAVADQVQLRVTATVQADRKVSAEVPGCSSCPAKIVQIPTAGWAKVHSSSVFAGKEGLGQPSERDDTARLEQIAASIARSQSLTLEADLTLGWVEPTCQLGDVIERIDRRGIELATLPGSQAHVTAIEHRCDENWSTHLKVSG